MGVHRELRLLSRAESLELLAGSWVGRVVLSAHALPTAVPVSYALDGESIVFRSGPGMKLSAAEAGTVVAFEVDDFDADVRVGWSVLVTGLAHQVTDAAEIARLDDLDLQTWLDPDPLGGYVRIEVTVISGRRVVPVVVGYAVGSPAVAATPS